jgi:hypothetical protein
MNRLDELLPLELATGNRVNRRFRAKDQRLRETTYQKPSA